MSRGAIRALVLGFAAVAMLAATARPASANIAASAIYAVTDNLNGTYTYNLLLKNTGTDPIRTFWFAWLPGFAGYYDFLSADPAGVGSPAGWTAQIENGYYGSSIDWYTGGAGLPAGASLGGFQFTSSDTPAYLLGNDSYFGAYKVTTSYVYGSTITLSDNYNGLPFGALLAAPGPVPEPATLGMALAGCGVPMLVARRRRA